MTLYSEKPKIFAMLDIYTLGDEVLRMEAEEVASFTPELKMLVDAMIDTLIEAEGIGLAAPQVGVSKKIFVVKLPDEDPIVFINPEIIETSNEVGPYEEGCLSIPGMYHDVIRPLEVMLQAQDVRGKAFTLKADGLLARVIQHENDHLHGKLYIDRIDDKERERLVKRYERQNRKKKEK